MKKLIILLALTSCANVFAFEGCSMNETQNILATNVESNGILTKVPAVVTTTKGCTSAPKAMKVGGWYPVFFNTYSQAQVDGIIKSIQAGKVQTIKITYDNNKALATKIQQAIQSVVNMAIPLDYVHTVDGTAKFNHDVVVVTINAK